MIFTLFLTVYQIFKSGMKYVDSKHTKKSRPTIGFKKSRPQTKSLRLCQMFVITKKNLGLRKRKPYARPRSEKL